MSRRTWKLDSNSSIAGVDRTWGDFTNWYLGDLLSNTIRPIIAEYFIAVALGADDQPRYEWDMVRGRERRRPFGP